MDASPSCSAIMNSALLLVPLLILLASSAVAALFGLPRLNRRLSLTGLSWLLALAPLSAFVLLLILAPKTPADPPLVWSFDWLPAFGLRLGFYYDSLERALCPAGDRHRHAGDHLYRLLFQGRPDGLALPGLPAAFHGFACWAWSWPATSSVCSSSGRAPASPRSCWWPTRPRTKRRARGRSRRFSSPAAAASPCWRGC